MGKQGKLRKPSLKLKPQEELEDGRCHASRCRRDSEIVLELDAAAPYGVGRVEFCDEHYAKHCEE